MKKVLFVLFASTCLFNYSQAQQKSSSTKNTLSIGVKAGINYSNVYDTEGENFVADGKFGFAGGAFVAIPIASIIGFQPEILFSQRGFKGTGTLLGSSYSYTRTTGHLDIPLLLSIKPSNQVTILAGPQFSFLLSEKNEFNSAVANSSQEQQFKNDNVRKNTLSLIGGFDFNLTNIVLGLRGGWDMQKNNGDGTSSTPRYKNTWYQATIGFKLF